MFETEELVLVLDGESYGEGVLRKVARGGLTCSMNRLSDDGAQR